MTFWFCASVKKKINKIFLLQKKKLQKMHNFMFKCSKHLLDLKNTQGLAMVAEVGSQFQPPTAMSND